MTMVLLVEDNEAIRKSLAHTFELRQVSVLQAPDGVVAEDLLNGTGPKPELVLTDYQMPRADGLHVALVARRRFIPTIIMTGDAYDLRKRLEEASLDFPVLHKPFRFDELRMVAWELGVKL